MAVVNSEKGLMVAENAEGLEFKLEKVNAFEYDEYNNAWNVYPKEYLDYGKAFAKDTLKRSMYRVYVDDVTSNSSQVTGVRERQYVILQGGVYKLATYKVEYCPDIQSYELWGRYTHTSESNAYYAANRDNFYGYYAQERGGVGCFYMKNISDDPNQFVFVQTTQMVADDKSAWEGARIFVNQLTGLLEPAGLKSQGASNVYDNSVLSFAYATKYNYRDIRREGNTGRDSVEFFKQSNPNIFLYEGATMLDRINNAEGAGKNYSMFIDTANVANAAKPMFLIGLRYTDFDEHGSNIEDHNKFHYTVADYLVSLADSTNKEARDRDGNIRLGFVKAKHEGQTLTIASDDKKFDLSSDEKLTPVSFAFRYVDTTRDAFYIETAAKDGSLRWIKTLNEVPVLVNDIQQAEIFNVKEATSAPTSNEAVEATEVSVVAVNGAVIVKGVAGKAVTVSNILGQTLADEVIASDNETIAVPAGIAVVAVDGEEAVKVVVK